MKLFSDNHFSGWFGEMATKSGLAQGLDATIYWPLHDVIIPNGRGGTTQIDHVILSRFGIFVIETKNRNGLIIGAPGQQNWRQFQNGRTFDFYNPLMQNEGHVKALAKLLNLPQVVFHSIIFFCGTVCFAVPMPNNVRTEGVTTVIHSKNNIILASDELMQAWNVLCACKQNPNLTLAGHLRYLRSLNSRNRPAV